jgi:hypothetical protein
MGTDGVLIGASVEEVTLSTAACTLPNATRNMSGIQNS